MTELDQLIAKAYQSQGNQETVNKAYLMMLKTQLFIPTLSDFVATEEQPFMPLVARQNDHYFILAFDSLEKLQQWAGDEFNQMTYVELIGRDVITSIGENVYLGLNYGSPYYKEFIPEEINYLKKLVAKVQQLTQVLDRN